MHVSVGIRIQGEGVDMPRHPTHNVVPAVGGFYWGCVCEWKAGLWY